MEKQEQRLDHQHRLLNFHKARQVCWDREEKVMTAYPSAWLTITHGGWDWTTWWIVFLLCTETKLILQQFLSQMLILFNKASSSLKEVKKNNASVGEKCEIVLIVALSHIEHGSKKKLSNTFKIPVQNKQTLSNIHRCSKMVIDLIFLLCHPSTSPERNSDATCFFSSYKRINVVDVRTVSNAGLTQAA